jgi:chromosome segregation ATPase
MGTPIEDYRPLDKKSAAGRLSLVKHEQYRNGIQLKNSAKLRQVSAEIARLDERLRKTSRRDSESRHDYNITRTKLENAQQRLRQLVNDRERCYLKQLERVQAQQERKQLEREERKQARRQFQKMAASLYDECEAAVVAEELREAKQGL